MTDTITLTRAQWNQISDGLNAIRDHYDGLFEVAAALSVLGLDKPAGTITAVQDEIGAEINRCHAILIAGDDAKPLPEKLIAFGKWFREFNKSRKEA